MIFQFHTELKENTAPNLLSGCSYRKPGLLTLLSKGTTHDLCCPVAMTDGPSVSS